MINQIDSPYWHKFNGLLRHLIVLGARPPGQLRPLVNEYPKSGGSWMAQMISGVSGLAFPRNRLPSVGDSVMHGHYKAKHIGVPVVNVTRDGRDVITSFYYHRLVSSSLGSTDQREKTLKKLCIKDPLDVQKYLPRFIELVATGGTHPYISWSDFVLSWCGNPAVIASVKYEDMLKDSAKEVTSVCLKLGMNVDPLHAKKVSVKYSFASQSQRSRGVEDSSHYLRKGVSGDWTEKFNLEARQLFEYYMGQGLIDLGYEKNSSWVLR